MLAQPIRKRLKLCVRWRWKARGCSLHLCKGWSPPRACRWISAASAPLPFCKKMQRHANTAASLPRSFNSLNPRFTALDILHTSCRKIASILIYSCGPLSQPLGILELKFGGMRRSQRYARADNAVEVVTQADTFSAASAVDCRGAWSGAPVRPRKGQMLYVQPQASVLQHVLRAPEVYLVPRSSGKILIGATVEDVGFDKSVDPSAIRN